MLEADGEENHDDNERSKTFKPPSLTPFMPPLPLPLTRKSDRHKIIALGDEFSVVVHNELSA